METSITEEAADWAAVKAEPGMPEKLIAWRQKLSEKANLHFRPRSATFQACEHAFRLVISG